VHLSSGQHSVSFVLGTLFLGVFGLIAIIFGNFARRDRDDDSLQILGWALVSLGSVGTLLAMLTLTGLVAGVK
jgi:hypothetical protein